MSCAYLNGDRTLIAYDAPLLGGPLVVVLELTDLVVARPPRRKSPEQTSRADLGLLALVAAVPVDRAE